MNRRYNLAIVGAGLSALSALCAGLASERTILLDYQETPGGFLRHALPVPGFEEAWELIQSFQVPREVTACFATTAVGLLPASEAGEPHILLARGREGTLEIHAGRVLIACGGLELTRERAQIPGTRPAGVITPIMAHQLLARSYLPGRRAIVYGSTRYAQATAKRLTGAGLEVTLIHPAASELVAIAGFPRLESITFRRDNRLFDLPADTLVYSVGMVANTHWLRGSGVITGLDGTIQVDADFQTSVAGVYAIGTVVAPSLDHADSLAMGKEVASLLVGETR